MLAIVINRMRICVMNIAYNILLKNNSLPYYGHWGNQFGNPTGDAVH